MSKKVKERGKSFPIIIGVVAALTVFVIGFGVMLIMYNHWQNHLTERYAGLKGLFDYKASLWGDAFCLPLIVGAGITYILVFYKKVQRKRKLLFPIIAGVVGGAAGLAMQMQWVISDTTPLNWSIPEQHHFNYAGWYHAVFFVIICFLVSFISACLIQIDIYLLQNIDLSDSYEKNIYCFCQFLIWLSGILFLQLHYLDDYSDRFPQWGIILFWAVIGLAVLCGFRFVILKKKRSIQYFTPVIFAVIISTTLSFVSITKPSECDVSFLVSSILFSTLYVTNSENKAKMFFLALLFGSVTWLCNINVTVNLKSGNYLSAIVFALCCVLVPFVISLLDIRFFNKESKIYTFRYILILSFATAISVTLIVLANLSTLSTIIKEFDTIDNIKYEVGSFLISIIIPRYVEFTFSEIKRLEDERCGSKQIDNYKLSQYIIYFMLYASAVILLINCLYFNYSIQLDAWSLAVAGAALLIVVICCTMIKAVKRIGLSIVFLVFCYLSIVVYLILTGIHNTAIALNKFQTIFNSVSFWIVITLIVIYACTISVFITFSFMNNVALIRQKELKRETSISAMIIGVLSGLCYGLASYQLMLVQTVFYMIQMLIVTMLAFAVIPYLQASVLNPGGDVGILDNYARSSVMQDGFLYSAVVTVNPIVTISLLDRITKGYWIHGIILYVVYSLLLSPLWSYCVRNNVEHCYKKEARCKELCTQDSSNKEILCEQYNNLRIHLTVQNIIAIILSIPYSPIFMTRIIYDSHKDSRHRDDYRIGLLPR